MLQSALSNVLRKCKQWTEVGYVDGVRFRDETGSTQ